jgi:hypothetical protein
MTKNALVILVDSALWAEPGSGVGACWDFEKGEACYNPGADPLAMYMASVVDSSYRDDVSDVENLATVMSTVKEGSARIRTAWLSMVDMVPSGKGWNLKVGSGPLRQEAYDIIGENVITE